MIVADSGKKLRTEDSPITAIIKQWRDIRKNFSLLLSPGDSQFKDLPKRVRLMLISLIIPLLHLITRSTLIPGLGNIRLAGKFGIFIQQYSVLSGIVLWIISVLHNQPLITGLVIIWLGRITYKGLIWGMNKQIRKESRHSILLIGALFSVSISLFIEVIFTGALSNSYAWGLFVFASAIYMILLYILSLIINILNVNLFYTIPLSRLGESGIYIFSVVIYFLFSISYVKFAFPLFLTFQWGLLAIVTLIFLLSILLNTGALISYFLPTNRDISKTIVITSLLIFIFSILFFSMFTHGWIAAIIGTLTAYLLSGYSIHKQQNSMKNIVKIEFFSIILLIITVAITQ